MVSRYYVYIIGGSASANYEVEEEYSYVAEGVAIKLIAHLSDRERTDLSVTMQARVMSDETLIDSIHAEPPGQHHDLVVAMMEELATRNEAECVPTDVVCENEEQYWEAYLARPKDAPPLASIWQV